ncbi:MAG: ComEC/Rec2 family competence protein [Clostridia bacterium]|nr:ComEC/Rec2 family competence protein [Clostridia bacterium]
MIALKRMTVLSAILCSMLTFTVYYFNGALLPLGAVLILILLVLSIKTHNSCIITVMFFVGVTVLSLSTVCKNVKTVDDFSGGIMTLRFTATENCEHFDNYSTVNVITNGNSVIGNGSKFEIFYQDKNLDISAGDIFDADVMLKSLDGSKYKTWRFSDGIYSDCSLERFIGIKGKNNFFYSLNKIRNYITKTLFLKLPYFEAATLNAITTGNKTYLSDEFYGAVKTTGVSHVMVVSGLHLSIIMSGFYTVLDRLFYNKYLRFTLSITTVFAIIAVCGFTTSIIRAGIMYIIASFAPLFERDSDTLSNLCTAVTLIIISSPFVVFNVAFQLSVLCTFGVVYIAPFFIGEIKKYIPKSFILNVITEITVVTLSATFMSMPILIYNFGSVSLISSITNILISYAVTGALLFIVCALSLNLLPVIRFISEPFFITAGLFAKYINNVILKLSKLPFASVGISNEALIDILTVLSVMFIIAVLLIMYACKMRRHLLKLNQI